MIDSEDEGFVNNEILEGNIKTDVAHRYKYELDDRNRRLNQVRKTFAHILGCYSKKQVQNNEGIV
jgi:hypothetical protein